MPLIPTSSFQMVQSPAHPCCLPRGLHPARIQTLSFCINSSLPKSPRTSMLPNPKETLRLPSLSTTPSSGRNHFFPSFHYPLCNTTPSGQRQCPEELQLWVLINLHSGQPSVPNEGVGQYPPHTPNSAGSKTRRLILTIPLSTFLPDFHYPN